MRQLLLLTFLSVLTSLPSPGRASSVTFTFTGQCAQACSEVSLVLGQQVSGTLRIDSAFLPTAEGTSTEVLNSNLLDLEFGYGSQFFRLPQVVLEGRLLFTLLGGGYIVSNGVGLLARNTEYELLIAPAGDGLSLPLVGAWLYSESVASWGTFAAPVPEPASAVLLLAGLLSVGLVVRAGRRGRRVGV